MMGHALAALVIPDVDPVHKVSIIPRGVGALGYTIQCPTEDRFLMTAEELVDKMIVLLGGRAAEHLVFEHLSTGAVDDLQKVTDIARSMVVRYGMSERLGHAPYESDRRGFLGREQTTSREHGDATHEPSTMRSAALSPRRSGRVPPSCRSAASSWIAPPRRFSSARLSTSTRSPP